MIHTKIHERLKEIARNEDTAVYTEIAPLDGLDMSIEADRDKISKLLDEINKHEHAAGRPLLSSVVILADRNMPGYGYFTCAKNLAVYKGKDDLKFWLTELRRVHDYWKAHRSSVAAPLGRQRPHANPRSELDRLPL